MTESHLLVDTLKRLLRSRGLTYAKTAAQLGLSEASVKRMFSRRTFTLARIEALCALVDIDLLELARLARGRSAEVHEMTPAQEAALAEDPALLGVFYLALNGFGFADIVARYRVTNAQCTTLLLKLERLGLIELMPGNRLKLKAPAGLRLRADGPIRREYGACAVADFLAPQFDQVGGYFTFEFRELSRASREILQRKLERLVFEFHELAELDAHLPSSARETMGMAVGIRPWTIADAIGLAPRRGAAPRALR